MHAGSDYFWVVLLGQFVAAFGNTVYPVGSPLLSETWFPSSERATATAIGGAIAPQIGTLFAMGVTPMVIHSPLTERVCNTSNTASPGDVQAWKDEVYYRWLYYQSAVAGAAILAFLLTLCSESVTLEPPLRDTHCPH
jgi:MFS family permease